MSDLSDAGEDDEVGDPVVEHSRAFYDSIAERFATWSESSPYNAYYERPALRTLLGAVEGLRILDAGCAAGSHSEWVVEHGASTVVALDNSPKMVELARCRLGDRVQVHLADLSRPLPFLADGSFDLVVSSLVLHDIRDWNVPFGEFHRILVPGGGLVLSIQHPMTDWQMFGDGSYFDVEAVEWPWRGIGAEMLSRFYRFPLQAMTDPLFDAGFLIERLVEPRPLPGMAERDAEQFELLMRRPAFLLLRCLRP
jgi:SAM-dependent methyltransferase